MLVGAEDAPVLQGLGVQAGGIPAAGQRAHLPVLGVVLPAIRAVGADEALDEAFADLLAEVDALAVEPVLADVAAYHPSVVVRSPAQTVRAVVGPVVGAATPLGIPRGLDLGPGAFGLPRLLRGRSALLPVCRLHLGGSRG